MTNKTTAKVDTFYAYTLNGTTKEYITLESGDFVKLVTTRKNQGFSLIKVIGVDAYELIKETVKYQTEVAFAKALITLKERNEKKATSVSSRESKKAIALLPKVHMMLTSKKEESRKQRNKAILSVFDELNTNGQTRREYFLNIIKAVELLGNTVNPIIKEYANTLK
ncbi:MAG: hypothetical protein GY787_13010 [Alteromonadales bacterium]|nr:hypothetical protein [Alteromonadales bacterium]